MKAKLLIAAVAGVLGITAYSGVQARELKFNMFQPPRTLEAQVYNQFFDELAKETGGSLTGKVFAGGQLLNAPGTLKGIKDKVVDGGFIVPSLNLGELKHIAMVPDMLPWVVNSNAAAAAGQETILVTCEECKQEQENYGIWYFGGQGPTSWNIMCAKPVADFADFQGRKVRVTGSSATRMIRALGGVAVQMRPPEIGPALAGGQIDCAVGPNAWLADYSLWDSVKHVIDLDLGIYHGLGLFVVNRDTFASFTPQEKSAFISLTIKYGLINTEMYRDQQVEVRRLAEQRGINFAKPEQKFVDALNTFRDEDQARLIEDFRARGVADPERIVKQHLATIEKWVKIVEKSGDDRAALSKAINDEIYSKVKY